VIGLDMLRVLLVLGMMDLLLFRVVVMLLGLLLLIMPPDKPKNITLLSYFFVYIPRRGRPLNKKERRNYIYNEIYRYIFVYDILLFSLPLPIGLQRE